MVEVGKDEECYYYGEPPEYWEFGACNDKSDWYAEEENPDCCYQPGGIESPVVKLLDAKQPACYQSKALGAI